METDTASYEQSDKEKAEAEKELSETLALVPNYEVLDEDLKEVGIYKVSLETDSTDEKEIESLITHTVILANEKNDEVNSINVAVRQTDVDALNIATGRVALTNKGLA